MIVVMVVQGVVVGVRGGVLGVGTWAVMVVEM